LKQQRGITSSKARSGEFPDVGIDVGLAKYPPSVEGTDATGYKVTLPVTSTFKKIVYVVKEDGHYKVLTNQIYLCALGLEVLDRVAANDLSGARVLLDWVRDDHHLSGGDDPLAGFTFPRLWTKGKDADARAMQLAAGSILIEVKETAPRGIEILEAGLKSTSSESEKLGIQLGLLLAFTKLKQYDKLLALSSEVAKQFPESKRTFLDQVYVLRIQHNFAEADRLAQERLQRIPGDPDAMRALFFNATEQADYAKAYSVGQKIVETGKAEGEDFNNAAWISLFMPKIQTADIENALKAAQLSNNNPSYLHTLGSLYAEVGKTKEAREVLVQAMDSSKLDEPDDSYFYAFGSIAEQFGERNAAIADYERVKKPEDSIDIFESV
jgi:tetratricopeptide (TPR) repeat protein